jgi:hypothetical protein
MNYTSQAIQEAYKEKLHEQIGTITTFKTLLQCHYGSESDLIADLISGKLKIDGPSATITLCEHRFFEDMQETCTHDDEGIND